MATLTDQAKTAPPIQYLFRFRDLVAPTVEEHKKIISQQRSCWWGWWKRPSEDNRLEVWQALAESASSKAPVPVGLFHSGEGKVYRAWVTEVIKPRDGLQPSQEPLPVPSHEAD